MRPLSNFYQFLAYLCAPDIGYSNFTTYLNASMRTPKASPFVLTATSGVNNDNKNVVRATMPQVEVECSRVVFDFDFYLLMTSRNLCTK